MDSGYKPFSLFDSNDDKFNSNGLHWENGELTYLAEGCTSIPLLLCRSYGHLARKLDLSFNSLRRLDGLEHFSKLQELVLDNNQLEDGSTFPYLPHLHTLSLNKNCFSNLEEVVAKVKSSYPQLRYLSLLGNPACPDQLTSLAKDEHDYRNYRLYVVHHLTQLAFLDCWPVRNQERLDSKRAAAFMEVVRWNPSQGDGAEEEEDPGPFTRLDVASIPLGCHRGAYGVLKYKYSGKHSEGNRFIRNSEL